mmetsp:Transcript_22981/g.57587  ORF Transcript_22981/g.57587 Transcript_22981/m.57587 type:complete len:222 (+) Transcript_22981:891-1556(+)
MPRRTAAAPHRGPHWCRVAALCPAVGRRAQPRSAHRGQADGAPQPPPAVRPGGQPPQDRPGRLPAGALWPFSEADGSRRGRLRHCPANRRAGRPECARCGSSTGAGRVLLLHDSVGLRGRPPAHPGDGRTLVALQQLRRPDPDRLPPVRPCTPVHMCAGAHGPMPILSARRIGLHVCMSAVQTADLHCMPCSRVLARQCLHICLAPDPALQHAAPAEHRPA